MIIYQTRDVYGMVSTVPINQGELNDHLSNKRCLWNGKYCTHQPRGIE